MDDWSDLRQMIGRQTVKAELYGRLHQTVELFQAGAIDADTYSKWHKILTDKLSVVNSTNTDIESSGDEGVSLTITK